MTSAAQTQAEPIPWVYTDEQGMLQWAWVTEHFAARIVGIGVVGTDGSRTVRFYQWELADRMRMHQGMPRVLIEGQAAAFDEAERLIREHVGKCYDPRLGYRRYSGALAFTYEISTGERVDVSSFIGSEVTLDVANSSGGSRTIRGDFDVRGYRWRITTAQSAWDVVPEHVLTITDRSEQAMQAAEFVRPASFSGVGRIYREEHRAGCTGRPGFLPDTVDHAGAPRCPLHEATLPDHLLH